VCNAQRDSARIIRCPNGSRPHLKKAFDPKEVGEDLWPSSVAEDVDISEVTVVAIYALEGADFSKNVQSTKGLEEAVLECRLNNAIKGFEAKRVYIGYVWPLCLGGMRRATPRINVWRPWNWCAPKVGNKYIVFYRRPFPKRVHGERWEAVRVKPTLANPAGIVECLPMQWQGRPMEVLVREVMTLPYRAGPQAVWTKVMRWLNSGNTLLENCAVRAALGMPNSPQLRLRFLKEILKKREDLGSGEIDIFLDSTSRQIGLGREGSFSGHQLKRLLAILPKLGWKQRGASLRLLENTSKHCPDFEKNKVLRKNYEEVVKGLKRKSAQRQERKGEERSATSV
jgi:hypothetical protein